MGRLTIGMLKKLCQEQKENVKSIILGEKDFAELKVEMDFPKHYTEIKFLVNDLSLFSFSSHEVSVTKSEYLPRGKGHIITSKANMSFDVPYESAMSALASLISDTTCGEHEYVNVGFTTIVMVCKKCNKEQ